MSRGPAPRVEPVAGQGAWSRTLLVLGREPVIVDLRQPAGEDTRRALVSLGLGGPFAVITPCNPQGELLSHAANTARLEAFAAQELGACPGAIPAEGRSPDGTHREPGWALAVPLEDACRIATRWHQLGFYWWDGARFGVVRTVTPAGGPSAA